VLDGVKAALKAHGAEPSLSARISADGSSRRRDRHCESRKSGCRRCGWPSNTVAPILQQSHQGLEASLLTVSFVGTDELIREAGPDAEAWSLPGRAALLPDRFQDRRLYRRTLTKYAPSAQPNFVSLEGFVDAMVLVEGIKKAGKD